MKKKSYLIVLFILVILFNGCILNYQNGRLVGMHKIKDSELREDIYKGCLYIEKLPENDSEFNSKPQSFYIDTRRKKFYSTSIKRNQSLAEAFQKYPYKYELLKYGSEPVIKDSDSVAYYLYYESAERIVRESSATKDYVEINYNILALKNLGKESIINKFTTVHMHTFAPSFINAVVNKSKNSGSNL